MIRKHIQTSPLDVLISQEEGKHYAHCLPFDLLAEGESREDAKRKLGEMILEYVKFFINNLSESGDQTGTKLVQNSSKWKISIETVERRRCLQNKAASRISLRFRKLWKSFLKNPLLPTRFLACPKEIINGNHKRHNHKRAILFLTAV